MVERGPWGWEVEVAVNPTELLGCRSTNLPKHYTYTSGRPLIGSPSSWRWPPLPLPHPSRLGRVQGGCQFNGVTGCVGFTFGLGLHHRLRATLWHLAKIAPVPATQAMTGRRL